MSATTTNLKKNHENVDIIAVKQPSVKGKKLTRRSFRS